MRLYIAVLDEFPDYMTPTLVAHSMLGAHLFFTKVLNMPEFKDRVLPQYEDWLENSFKKCVVRVNQKEFDKISDIPFTYIGWENNTLGGKSSCAIPLPTNDDNLPNVLKYAKLWKPKEKENQYV